MTVADVKKNLDDRGFYLCRRFIGGDLLPILSDEARKGPSRRTSLGGEAREWWTEYAVKPEGLLAEALTGIHVQPLIDSAIGPVRWTSQSWVHHYTGGERIPCHRDASGDSQLVLCLLAPPPVNGGLFLLRQGGETVAVDLRPGDAVLFRATKILHATTRLKPTAEVPKPERTVAVVRFYIAKG